MHVLRMSALAGALLLSSVTSVLAQTPVDPTGHWEGAITAPFGEVVIEIDLARNAKGEITGTFGNPTQNLKGFPLSQIVVDGRAIGFAIRPSGDGGGRFQGILLADGKSMSGDFAAPMGTVPFNLTRTGEARIEPAPRNAPIASALEGTWTGTLSAGGKEIRLLLKMANQADGTAAGVILDPETGVEVTLGLTVNGSTLTLNATPLKGNFFSGTLNQAGTELAGTYTEGPLTLPLIFKRS
ncbi:MAG TPA: hypothetical protein VI485_00780 [Vicinamibacterales bacterium]|nr:hypothetical protein [Vicinamibacterales bacterium]